MILQNRIKTTLMVDANVYREIRILAIRRNLDVGEVVEQALRNELERSIEEMTPKRSEIQPQSQPQTRPKTIHKTIRLPGIEFPADRSKIIKEIDKSTLPKETNFLKFISDKKYKNELDLENELNKENTTKENDTVIFKIINEKLRKEQESKVIS